MITSQNHGQTMTVGELIAELQKHPPDAPVLTQGCDCNGNGNAFKVTEEDGEVMIERGREDES